MSDTRKEIIILRNLIYNEDYSRFVMAYLKPEHFKYSSDKAIFQSISEYITSYKKLPNRDVLETSLQKNSKINDETLSECQEILDAIEAGKDTEYDLQWLKDETEEWGRDRELANAAYLSVSILDGKEKKLDKGVIPEIFEKALSFNFNPAIAQDFTDDAEERYDSLRSVQKKLPFNLIECDRATEGGVEPGTLNLLVGGVYAGKTLGLCSLAASYLLQGKNVLYVTLEISAHNILNRIDCNLLNIPIDQIKDMPKDIFLKKVQKIREQTPGKLKVQEYPTSSIHVNHLRALIYELELKKKFKPDVVLVDYLGIMVSSRVKDSDKTHITFLKIGEELRALAQELQIPFWSAAQLDAEGMNSSDPTMTNVSGSKVGLPATVDLMWMIVVNDKLKEMGQILIVQQKNRYKDISERKKFYIGVDRKKFRWYECDQKANAIIDREKDEEDDEDSDEKIKQMVSKKYGQEAYNSAYKTVQSAKFGPRKAKFSDFIV